MWRSTSWSRAVVADVVEDRGPVGDRLALLPGPEVVAEREHVRVRADARIAEQVPGAADGVARLEDRVGLARALRLEVAGGADAGEAGADDQHVDVFGCHRRGSIPAGDAPPRNPSRAGPRDRVAVRRGPRGARARARGRWTSTAVPYGGSSTAGSSSAKVPLAGGRIQLRRAPCPLSATFAGCVYTGGRASSTCDRVCRAAPHPLPRARPRLRPDVVLNMRERARFKRIVGHPPVGLVPGSAAAGRVVRRRVRAVRDAPPAAGRDTPDAVRLRALSARPPRVCRLIRSAATPHGRRPKRPKNPPRVVEVAPPPPSQTGQGGCTLVDQLLTGCSPPPPPPPAPAPAPVPPV